MKAACTDFCIVLLVAMQDVHWYHPHREPFHFRYRDGLPRRHFQSALAKPHTGDHISKYVRFDTLPTRRGCSQSLRAVLALSAQRRQLGRRGEAE